MPSPKRILATAFDATGLNRLGLALQARSGPYVRALNYHDVPPRLAGAFEAQLEHFARHFDPVGEADLLGFLDGTWAPRRPGLVLTFDDGLASHAEVVAPLLERHGFPGWFAVPASFPDVGRVDDHAAFMERHRIHYDADAFPGRSPVVDWDDLRRLDREHVICCHSFHHRRLRAGLDDAERAREIPEAKAHLERALGHEVATFVWVGGEEWSYSASAMRAIRDAGFRLSLMTNSAPIRPAADRFHLQRTNVEASDGAAVARFALSGALDWIYRSKRRRVDRITELAPAVTG